MNQILGVFIKLTDTQKILVTTILSVVLYVASASIAYSVFSRTGLPKTGGNGLVSSLPGPSNVVDEEDSDPKTEVCPLNGSLKSKQARESWEKRRPLAVMIENHVESRPQSGLSSADVIYEAVAEGGITRFMALFYCNLSDIQVGPVRSARTYYLDWLSEYDALYAHVGGANAPGPADALGQIIKYKVKDLNQFSIGFPVFWRDYQRLGHSVATEHTMYSTTQKLWEIGAKRGWTNVDDDKVSWNKNFTPWKFNDPAPDSAGQAANIKVNFWDSQPDYTIEWIWDPADKSYERKNSGVDHLDLNNKRKLQAKNIVVQFMRESNANDGYPGNVHLLYGTTGTGRALIFQGGKVTEGKWIKPSRIARTKYTDNKGKEIEFNPGQIWIQTVPEGSKVNY